MKNPIFRILIINIFNYIINKNFDFMNNLYRYLTKQGMTYFILIFFLCQITFKVFNVSNKVNLLKDFENIAGF